MYSESHCHLRRLDGSSLKQTMKKAEEANIEIVLVAGVDVSSSKKEIQNAKRYSTLKACVGIHPWNADQYNEHALSTIKKLTRDDEVVAISEIGLDYVVRRDSEGNYVDQCVEKSIQRAVFREQLRLAVDLDLPVLIHDRAPNQEVLNLLEEEGNTETGVAIHGFTKDLAYATRCMDLGIYLSIGLRAISQVENNPLREVVKQIPLTSLLLETDSTDPQGVVQVAHHVGELKGCSKTDVGRITTENLKKLIGF